MLVLSSFAPTFISTGLPLKEIFKLWTISNYYEIEEELLETEKEELEKEEKNKKFLLLNKLSNLLSLEELENIVNEYDKE